MVSNMSRSRQDTTENIAASAFEVRRAAAQFQQRASAPGVVAALPLALADIEKALERLAMGAVEAARHDPAGHGRALVRGARAALAAPPSRGPAAWCCASRCRHAKIGTRADHAAGRRRPWRPRARVTSKRALRARPSRERRASVGCAPGARERGADPPLRGACRQHASCAAGRFGVLHRDAQIRVPAVEAIGDRPGPSGRRSGAARRTRAAEPRPRLQARAARLRDNREAPETPATPRPRPLRGGSPWRPPPDRSRDRRARCRGHVAKGSKQPNGTCRQPVEAVGCVPWGRGCRWPRSCP